MVTKNDLRVLIVAQSASMKFGGEASLPLYYFKLFRERGVATWMLVHERTRGELRESLGDDSSRVAYVSDGWFQRLLFRTGRLLPKKIDEQTFGQVRRLWTQMLMRRVGRRVVREHQINIIHEAAPISPKEVSLMHTLGAPLVCGPLCGGMDYPPAFQYMQTSSARIVERLGRAIAHLLHRLARGKLRAAALVVANHQTRDALPRGAHGRVYEVVESGVDLEIWTTADHKPSDGKVRFVFSGRLETWKGADLTLEAFKHVADRSANAVLDIIGEGVLRKQLEARTDELKLRDRVTFTGWLSRPESAARIRAADVFMLPSMRECGGTVILEAFAVGLPVIASNWGGPGNYVDDTSGIRVNPDSRDGFINGLAEAMTRLANDEALRTRLSQGARARASSNYFDWDSKADRMLEVFQEVLNQKA